MLGSSRSVNDFGHFRAIMDSKFCFHMLDEIVIRMCETWCPSVLAKAEREVDTGVKVVYRVPHSQA